MVTTEARLAIMVVYEVDEAGVVPESEFAVSDPFSIETPTGVDASKASFALRPANPVAGPLTVSFSLTSADPALLAVYVVGGRKVVARAVGSSGAGWHTVWLGELPAGGYVVRLSQAGRSVSARVVVIR